MVACGLKALTAGGRPTRADIRFCPSRKLILPR